MKESYIRKKCLDMLAKEGYVCWWPYPPRNTYAKEKDILSIFDVLAVKRGTSEVRWIQLTSLSNVAARRKKIQTYFGLNNVFLRNSEVWGYDIKTHAFRIFPIVDAKVEQIEKRI